MVYIDEKRPPAGGKASDLFRLQPAVARKAQPEGSLHPGNRHE